MDAWFDLRPAVADDGHARAPVSGRPHAAPRSRGEAAADETARSNPCLGELLGALSHALDLAEGQPPGHALRSCWIAQQVGRAIGLGTAALHDLFHATLLKDAGGSGDAARLGALFLADDRAFKRERRRGGAGLPGRIGVLLRQVGAGARPAARLRALANALRHGGEIERELGEARCARGAEVARQLRLGEDVVDALQALDERWDGSGLPQGLAGKDIPLYARIALLAQAVDVRHAASGPQAAREEVARLAGRWFDPRLADAFAVLSRDAGFWRGLTADGLLQRVLETAPPEASQPVADDVLDEIAAAFGEIVDAKSPWTAGHSARVALVADHLARRLGLDHPSRRWLRRGALLHDLGMLGVSNRILDKPGPLDASEWRAVRRHALQTEQILGRVGSLASLARIAGAHHERLDGCGYPRGLGGRHIRLETRILTTADVFDALTADRPWRPALPAGQALQALRERVGTAIDPDCFAALAESLASLGDTGAFRGV